MRSLEQFWHWYTNEKPNSRGRRDKLSTVAWVALQKAEEIVADRAEIPESNAIASHTEAVRDLSLVLCKALESTWETVPEPDLVWGTRSPLVSLMNERNRIVAEIEKAEDDAPTAWYIGPEQWAALPEIYAQSLANQMHRDAERERMAEQYTTMALPDALTQQLACQARADARRAEAIRLVEMGALSVERFNQIMESLDTTPQ